MRTIVIAFVITITLFVLVPVNCDRFISAFIRTQSFVGNNLVKSFYGIMFVKFYQILIHFLTEKCLNGINYGFLTTKFYLCDLKTREVYAIILHKLQEFVFIKTFSTVFYNVIIITKTAD